MYKLIRLGLLKSVCIFQSMSHTLNIQFLFIDYKLIQSTKLNVGM